MVIHWDMVDTFAALAEPNRYRIVEMLRGGGRPVMELVEGLELSQPLVSKHLRILREAGLVEMRPVSRQHLYALRAEGLRALHTWLERYREIWDARFEALDDVLEELKEKERDHGRKKR